MKKLVSLTLICLAALSTANAKIPTMDVSSKHNPTLSKMLKIVTPAVVNISIRGDLPMLPPQLQKKGTKPEPTSPYLPTRKFASNGSGIIVDAENGYIVTNAHVVHYGKVITVMTNDGRMLKAKIIGSDPATDIAVIQVKDKYLKAIPVADSDKIEPGDFVAAIGNPFGLHQTVTSGVVSALNRSIGIEGPGGYENFIQTDAPINPGNSGGALVDMQGRLVGMNTAILSPLSGSIGIGFAIPSNMVSTVMHQLIKYGKVKRGMLGVMVQSLTPDLADAFGMKKIKGAMVTNVIEDSPASVAGLQQQDVIQSINNQPVKNAAQLRSIIGLLPIDDKAVMHVRRQKDDITITAVIKSAESIKDPHKGHHLLQGIQLNNFYQLDMRNKEVKGVIVLNVNDASDGWFAGLRPGDVIISANGQPMTDISQLAAMANKDPKRLLLNVRRGSANLYLVIT